MKRITAVFLAMVMVLSLAACGGSTDNSSSAASSAAASSEEASSEEASSEETASAEMTTVEAGKLHQKHQRTADHRKGAHMRVFEDWALKAYSIINPGFDNTEVSKPSLNKTETLQQLVNNYPKMNKNLVAQGLGINRSLLSRNSNKASTTDVNMNNDGSV